MERPDPTQPDQRVVEHVARLARLDLDPQISARLARDLAAVLAHVAALQRVDTTDVPAWAAPECTQGPRPDGLRLEIEPEARLANAPEHEGGAFRVPKVL